MASKMEDDKFDEVFMQIAGQIGSVQGLLDKFFGFMHRKTDFYVEYDESTVEAMMGFPRGKAEKMILNSFSKNKMKDYLTQVEGTAAPSATKLNSSNSQGTQDVLLSISDCSVTDILSNPSPKIKSVDLNSKGQQMPIGNGGVADTYYWTQTLTEVTIYIDAESASRGKDIDCLIHPKSLKVVLLGNVLIEGEFEEAVRVDESMWTLNIGMFLFAATFRCIVSFDRRCYFMLPGINKITVLSNGRSFS